MAREDVHGSALLELLSTTEEPLTMSEAAEEVGCSRQRAFAWREANMNKLVGVTQGDRNAMKYMARVNPNVQTWQRAHQQQSTDDITIGTPLTVSGMAVKNGRVVLTLQGLNGEVLDAVMM